MFPDYWVDFLEKYNLCGKEVEVPENDDLTGLGIEILILDEAAAQQEVEELYPGIAVAKDGFIPVGGCAFGSGDPYFINERADQAGPLYRIYHDLVGEEGYDRDQAVVTVLQSYEDLAKHIRS